MSDIDIRREGRAGRITLKRPDAMNALTYEMCLAVEAAIDDWRDDEAVSLVIIDAEGANFCAGGDIVEMYRTATAGNFDYGRRFWADEYRLNKKIFEYPKPYIAFCQGFTMGGGVGVSLHGSHRIVGESSRIAMPECGIGLVPDVGGSLMLALAPGRLGEFLGMTGARMHSEGAIYADFADHFVPEAAWPDLKRQLVDTGDASCIEPAATQPPMSELERMQPEIDRHFGGETAGDILRSLKSEDTEFTARAIKDISRASPLSASCAIEIIRRVRSAASIDQALAQEYRFTYRSAEDGEFIEGIRAMVIDKDRKPAWRHESVDKVPAAAVAKMLLPLGKNSLKLEG